MNLMSNSNECSENAILEYSRRWEAEGYYSRAFLPFKNSVRKMESCFIASIAEYVAKHFSQSDPLDVLDIGCSDGVLTTELFTRSGVMVDSYIGIDINQDGLNRLSKRNGVLGNSVKLINGDINSIELKGGFDFIVLLNSSYGVSASSFQILVERLNDNGVLIALTNSKRGDFAKFSSNRANGFCYAEDILVGLGNLGIYATSIDLTFTFEGLSDEQNKNICTYLSGGSCENNDILVKTETEVLIAVHKNAQQRATADP